MAREVTIRMTVDSSGAVTGLRTLSTEAGKTGKALEQTGKKSGEAGSQIKNIAGAVDFAMKAFAALKAFDMVADFVNAGRAIRATSATFGALTSDIGGAARTLDLLRSATGGVVTDMNLMQANNRFLQMGLATTAESAAQLSRMAVILGGSMGKGASQAMEEFALLLANTSIPRLDTFGISAGRVRERIAELKKEIPGLSREQAFLTATMEQGTLAMERLGPAAEFSMDALSRLETSFANFTDTAKKQSAEAVVGILELLNLIGSGQVTLDVVINAVGSEMAGGGSATSAGATFGQNYGMALGQAVQRFLYGGVKSGMEEATKAGMESVDFDALMGIMDNTAGMQSLDQRSPFGALAFGVRTNMNIRGGITDLKTDVQWLFDTLLYETKQRQEEAYGVLNRATVGIINQGFNIGANIQGMLQNAQDYMRGNALGEFGKAQSSMISGFDPLLAGMGIDTKQLFNVSKDIALPEFMRPETAQAIANEYARVEEQWARMAELNEQGLITDDELARMTTFRDNMSDVNNQAQAAAQAFEKMSLTDLFGTTSGGMLGEIGDMTIKAMQEAGMSDEQIAASRRQFDVASGRETTSSLAFQEQLAPFLATLAPEEQVAAMQNLTTTLQEFTLAGGNLNDLSTQQMMGMTGFAPGGQAGEFAIQPGDTLGEVQQRLAAQGYELAISDLLAATGAASPRTVQPGTYGFGQTGAAMTNFDPAAYAASLFAAPGMALPGAGTFLDPGMMGGTGGMGGGGMGIGESMGLSAESATATDAAFSNILMSLGTMSEEYMPQFSENLNLASSNSEKMASGFSEAAAQAKAISAELTGMSETEHNVAINFTLKGDTATLNALMAVMGSGSDVTQAMTTATQANNGRPPGVDLRA